MRSIFSFILILFICTFHLAALDPSTPFQKYLMEQWGSQNGLPSDSVTSIVQTPDGYLWLGTSRGIVRFDGTKFEMVEDGIHERNTGERKYALFVDREGHLWIGSSGCVVKLEEGKMRKYPLEGGLPKDKIVDLLEDMNGNFWVIAGSAIFKGLRHSKFEVIDESLELSVESFSSIREDRSGNIWVGTMSDGLFEYQYEQFVRQTKDGLRNNDSITALYEDREGSLWIGTDHGLFLYRDDTTSTYTTNNGLSNNHVTVILEDRDGNLWVGTINGINMIKLGSDGQSTIETGLKNNIVTSLFEDRENNIWVGTDGSGLKQFKDGLFISYGLNEGLPNDYIVALCEDWNGDFWIGSAYGGLYKFRDNVMVESVMQDENLEDVNQAVWIKAIAQDRQGNLWVSTCGRGLMLKRDGQFTRIDKSDGLISDCVISIYCDRSGKVWLGTFVGLSIYQDGNFSSFTTADGLVDNVIQDIYEDTNGDIWMATSKGLNILKNGEVGRDSVETHLKEIPVSTIYTDSSGTVWLGTFNAGIFCYRDGQFYPISTRNGLATDVIYNILEDERGGFWLTSDTGIHRVKKNDLNEIVERKIGSLNCISYGISDGMGSIECTHMKSSVLKTAKGAFWFATKKGIAVLNPEKIKRRTLGPPNVVIEKMEVGEQVFESTVKEYVFQDVKKVGFFFTACSFAAPKRVKFRYKLEGYDEDWIHLESEESREAFYSNLDPGSYIFRVTACNDEGIWNGNESRVSIKIRTYFTKTWMFKALLIMAVFVTGTGSYLAFRRRRLEKNKRNKGPIIDPGKTEQCLKHLGYLLEVKKIYKDETISLQSLSEKLSIPPYQFSQIINTKLNKNFFDLINSFRIQEAKEQLTDPARSHFTILEIAYDVGFNSKVSFNKAFKKFTEMTPSQFRKKHKSH